MTAYRSSGFRRMRFTRSGTQDKKLLIRLFLGAVVLVLAMYGWIIYNGQLDEVWCVTLMNTPFYFILFALFGFGLYWWKTHETFTKAELAAFTVFVAFSAFPSVSLGYMYLTDLGDTECLNGKPQSAKYVEKYYTWETRKDRDGKTERYKEWHGPFRDVSTSVGEVSLTSSEWENWVRLWGGWPRVSSVRNNKADGGSGFTHPKIHTIRWDGQDETCIPITVPHRYCNYVKGADTAARRVGAKAGWEKLLKKYPKIGESTRYGPIDFDRVVVANTVVDANFVSTVDHTLDMALRDLGRRKQCNIVVYVAGTADHAFYYALEEHWSMGKKNDIAVIIGYTDQKIHWVEVMARTDHNLFKTKLTRKVKELETLQGKGGELANLILAQINAPGEEGYLRRPNAADKYLAASVQMPWWAFVIVVLFGAALQMPSIWLFIHD